MRYMWGRDKLGTVRVGNGHPLLDSCLENTINRAAWQTAVCGVAKNGTRLSRHACTGNYTQYLVINYNRKEKNKKIIY